MKKYNLDGGSYQISNNPEKLTKEDLLLQKLTAKTVNHQQKQQYENNENNENNQFENYDLEMLPRQQNVRYNALNSALENKNNEELAEIVNQLELEQQNQQYKDKSVESGPNPYKLFGLNYNSNTPRVRSQRAQSLFLIKKDLNYFFYSVT